MPCSHPASHSSPQNKKPGSAFRVARSPVRPPTPKSYCATVGFFASALLRPCKPSFTTEKEPRSAFCVARSPQRPPTPKSYCATVGFFASALLRPCKQAILHHRKGAAKRVLCSQVSSKATSPKILLRHGRIFCLCPAHTLQAIPHHRKRSREARSV